MVLTSDTEKELAIFQAQSYIASLAKFTNAATSNGFLSIIPDKDGTLRKTSLLLRGGILPGTKEPQR